VKYVDSRGQRTQRDARLLEASQRLMARGVPAHTIVGLVNAGKTADQIEAMFDTDGNPVASETEETSA